jgi:hypothetical protein
MLNRKGAKVAKLRAILLPDFMPFVAKRAWLQSAIYNLQSATCTLARLRALRGKTRLAAICNLQSAICNLHTCPTSCPSWQNAPGCNLQSTICNLQSAHLPDFVPFVLFVANPARQHARMKSHPGSTQQAVTCNLQPATCSSSAKPPPSMPLQTALAQVAGGPTKS